MKEKGERVYTAEIRGTDLEGLIGGDTWIARRILSCGR
jgi:hypothetical protein